MAVIVVPKFTKADITKMLAKRRALVDIALLESLRFVGENFVLNARDHGTYKDQTGNLRSSIGYIIMKNGQQLEENFEARGGSEGEERAKQVVEELKGKFPTGLVLIGVAGMDYAAAVESKGFDVISSSSNQAEISLRAALKSIEQKFGNVT